jgi:1-aminocyclopropane-1-carboxylate deaminase
VIERVLSSIRNSPVQEWKVVQNRRIWIKREDRSAFGLGTKIRRFQGFLELDPRIPVLLTGSLHSNFLSAFCLLFRIAGYRIHSLATAKNLNKLTANGILTQSMSHEFELIDLKVLKEKISAKQNDELHIIPPFGLSHLALRGMDSLWDEIDWSRYSHVVMDMGTGLGFLSGLDYLQKHSKKQISFVGILLGEKISSWMESIPLLSDKLKLKVHSQITHQLSENSSVAIIPPSILPGFGKQNKTLMDYIRNVYREFNLPLEPFYSAKSLYTLEQIILEFPKDSEILYIHQGGLLNWVDLFQ